MNSPKGRSPGIGKIKREHAGRKILVHTGPVEKIPLTLPEDVAQANDAFAYKHLPYKKQRKRVRMSKKQRRRLRAEHKQANKQMLEEESVGNNGNGSQD